MRFLIMMKHTPEIPVAHQKTCIDSIRTLEKKCAGLGFADTVEFLITKKRFAWNRELIILAIDSPRGFQPVVGIAICDLRPSSVHVEILCSIKKGVGSQLMKRVERVAEDMGWMGVNLLSTESAVNFYKKLGYRRGPLIQNESLRKEAVKEYQRHARASGASATYEGMFFTSNTNEAHKGNPKFSKLVGTAINKNTSKKRKRGSFSSTS